MGNLLVLTYIFHLPLQRPLQLTYLHFPCISKNSQSFFQILALNSPLNTVYKYSVITFKIPTKCFREFQKLMCRRENSKKYEGQLSKPKGKGEGGVNNPSKYQGLL